MYSMRIVMGCLVALLGLFAHLPVHANIIYRSQCVDPTPTCAGDANFNVEFEFTDSIVGGTTINAASPLFVGWRAASSIGDGFSIAGTSFAGNQPSEISFSFAADLSAILALDDTTNGIFIELTDLSEGTIVFAEGGPVFASAPRDFAPNTFGSAVYVELLRVPVPEPAAPLLLLAGLAGMAVTRTVLWRKRGK